MESKNGGKTQQRTSFEERCREVERKIVQKIDTAAAACKQAEDEFAATSEHVEGHNEATAYADNRKDETATKEHAERCDEATAVEDKGRNEAIAAAAKESDREDILRGPGF